MKHPPLPVIPDDLLQLMRQCSVARVRTQLNLSYKNDRLFYDKLVAMYTKAAKK